MSDSERRRRVADVVDADAGERPARGHLAREQLDARRVVELGIRRVEAADAVVEVGEGGVVLGAVLAHVERREAGAGGDRGADEAQDRAVRRQRVTGREHRVAHEDEVVEQLVEARVVAAGLVRGAVGRGGRGSAAGGRARSSA